MNRRVSRDCEGNFTEERISTRRKKRGNNTSRIKNTHEESQSSEEKQIEMFCLVKTIFRLLLRLSETLIQQ